ncbi:MAG: hypothetical protein ABL998_03765 [Planctomycetota bacterium]
MGAADATVGIEETSPWLVVPPSFVLTTVLTWWLFRERARGPESADRLLTLRRQADGGERFEPDPELDFRFAFVSTHADLLDAEAALRRERTGMRGWVRALAILWAAMVVVPATFALVGCLVRWKFLGWGTSFALLLGLVIGGGVMRSLFVRPWLQRRAIRRETSPTQELALHITPRAIEIEIVGVGRVRRLWSELMLCLPVRKGVLLSFVDVNNWLPARVFADAAERKRFEAAVAFRLAQEAMRFEGQLEEHPILPGIGSYHLAHVRHEVGSDRTEPYIELTLRRDEEERRLRFLRPAEVAWNEGSLEKGVTVRVLRYPHAELDGLAVAVHDAEALGLLSVLAEDVVEVAPLDA